MATPIATIAVRTGLDNANALIEAPRPLNAFPSPRVEAVAAFSDAAKTFAVVACANSAVVVSNNCPLNPYYTRIYLI